MPNPNRAMARMPKSPMVEVEGWSRNEWDKADTRPTAVGWAGECNAKAKAAELRAAGVKGATVRSWKGSNKTKRWTVWRPQ